MVKRMTKKKSRSASKAMSIPDGATTYRGPADLPLSRLGRQGAIIPLTVTSGQSSSGAGLLAFVIGNNPNTTSEWADLTPLYEEFRVLALEVHWEPYYPHWGSTAALAQNQAPLVCYPQRNAGSAAATTYSTAFQFGGSTVHSVQDRITQTIKMSGTFESNFQNTATPVAVAAVGFTAVGLSNTIQYGITFTRMLVQFRSRF